MFLTQCKTKIIKPCWKKKHWSRWVKILSRQFFLQFFFQTYLVWVENRENIGKKLCAMAIKRQTATWHPREESLPRMLWCQAYKGMFFFLFKTSNHRRIRSSLSSSLSYICLFFCACGCVRVQRLPMNSWLFVLFWIPYVKDFILYLICSVWLCLVCCIVVISLITRTRITMLS